MGKKVFAVIDSRAGGKAGICMVVNSKGRSQKIMAFEYPAGCNTASVIWGCRLAARWHVSRLRAAWMAMIHLIAFKTIFTTITAAGKRTGNEQTSAENQD